MQYPKISIVTQCFNRAPYIADTIESVLAQGYPNLEYIVIDDNSTDDSWEVIQRYRDRLTRCERLTEASTTPVPAINHAFSETTGDIMLWLNAKNVLMPKALFAVAAVFAAFPDIEWLSGIGLTIDEDGKVIAVVPYRKDYFGYLSSDKGNIQQESTFFRRALWERAGGQLDGAYPNAFDVGLWRKFFLAGGRITFLNTIVGAYRKNAQGMSVARRQEFESLARLAWRDLRAHTSRTDLILARLGRALRPLTPLLRSIPDRLWVRLPILGRLSHDAVKFVGLDAQGRGKPVRYKRNPYRTIFPE